MDQYRHHVSGFFAHLEEAESALSRLVEQGLPRERLHLFETDSAQPVTAQQTKSNEVLKDVLVDGAIGSGAGGGDADGAGGNDRTESHPGFGQRLQRRQHGVNAIDLMG